jgi:hypothetical protein
MLLQPVDSFSLSPAQPAPAMMRRSLFLLRRSRNDGMKGVKFPISPPRNGPHSG